MIRCTIQCNQNEFFLLASILLQLHCPGESFPKKSLVVYWLALQLKTAPHLILFILRYRTWLLVNAPTNTQFCFSLSALLVQMCRHYGSWNLLIRLLEARFLRRKIFTWCKCPAYNSFSDQLNHSVLLVVQLITYPLSSLFNSVLSLYEHFYCT